MILDRAKPTKDNKKMKKLTLELTVLLLFVFLRFPLNTYASVLFYDDFTGVDGTDLLEHNSAYTQAIPPNPEQHPTYFSATLSSNTLNVSLTEFGYTSYYFPLLINLTDQCISSDIQIFPGKLWQFMIRQNENPVYASAGYTFDISATPGEIPLLIYPNDQSAYNSYSAYYNFESGNWYNIKFCAIGSTISGYVNSEQVISFDDGTTASGMPGFWVSQIGQGYMDNLLITDDAITGAPQQQLTNLIATVEDFNLIQGISNSLDTKLENAQQSLADLNAYNDQAAVSSLQSFINAVEAQRGNKITNEQADVLVARAQELINFLSSW